MAKPRSKKGNWLTIRERRLGRERAHGMYHPSTRTIELDPRMNNKKCLEVTIHESMHDALPYLDEFEVTAKAKLIARTVWAVGYRRILK
jgi:hypothetical protein